MGTEKTPSPLNDVVLTKAGRPVEGEPQAGAYYRARPKSAEADRGAIAKTLRKLFPKSKFMVG